MANNRIFYATQAVALKGQNADGSSINAEWYYPRGLQSVGITTNFGLEQIFQLGQIELYDNIEDVPEVEVTMSKNIDGTVPLYLLCTNGHASGISGSNHKELVELANNRVNFRLSIYSDTDSLATGTPANYVTCSGMYLSSVSYSIPVDGIATEDVTLVGNNKVWDTGILGTAGKSIDSVQTAPASARRFKFNKNDSSLPTGSGGGIDGTRLQSIKISTDLGREAIFELGRMAPYFRYVKFPVEVTSEFELVATEGDGVDASDFSSTQGDCETTYTNLLNKPIKVVICGSGSGDKLTVDLGDKNKLTSVNYTGGDTGGGNATVTYSYQTFNKLKVSATGSFAYMSGVQVISPPAPPAPPSPPSPPSP